MIKGLSHFFQGGLFIFRQTIMDRLIEIEIEEWMIRILYDYFIDRYQYVRIGKDKSERKLCESGVIQEAFLSPVFFNMITNDMKATRNNCEIVDIC